MKKKYKIGFVIVVLILILAFLIYVCLDLVNNNDSDKVQKLAVNVKGHFNSFGGSYYQDAAGTKQKVVSVTGKTVDVLQGDSIDVVGAPDTGMTTAQTIYFIGLIVLLCGVGIVYANAKPAESK